MASLDFEQEKSAFRKFYESNRKHFNDAKNAYIRIISSLIRQSDVGEVAKIEGRIKIACRAIFKTPGLEPVNLSFLKERCIEKYEKQIPLKMRGCKKIFGVREV